jgi:nucleotide-binding universal stress UspA family protein
MVASMRIVVGVDGSPCSSLAVDWAAAEAVRRGAPLSLVHVSHPSWMALGSELPIIAPQEPPSRPAYLDDEASRLRRSHPELEVTCVDLIGSAAPALIEESADAALVVVGARGRARVVELVLGSVSRHVAAHAHCPAVVVRGDTSRIAAPVAVGIDDSTPSRTALRAACTEAALLGVPLIVMHAWEDLGYAAYGAWVPPIGTPDELADAAMATADDAVEEVAAAFPDVEIHVRVPNSHPVPAVLGLSDEAQLLVVGAHGSGVFPGMLLGSVTSAAIHDSRCPVLVVPTSRH